MDNVSLLLALHADLAPFVAAKKGKLLVSGTYVETIEILGATPNGFLCIIEWLGEENPDPENDLGVVRQEIGLYLAINPGLTLNKGEVLWLSENGKTLIERCNQIRDRIREIVLPDDEANDRNFEYRECRQVVTPDGIPLRAYRLLFQIQNALPEPDYRNVNP